MNALDWSYVGFHKGQGACQNCGKGIRNIVTLSNDGVTMEVGTTCAEQLMRLEDRVNFQKDEKRRKRAARQWREWNKGDTSMPAPRINESRDSYIARRVAEMGNAMTAWSAYVKRMRSYKYSTPGDLMYWVKEYGMWMPEPVSFGFEGFSAYRIERDNCYRVARAIRTAEICAPIEKQYNANRYDFVGERSWDVQKI